MNHQTLLRYSLLKILKETDMNFEEMENIVFETIESIYASAHSFLREENKPNLKLVYSKKP